MFGRVLQFGRRRLVAPRARHVARDGAPEHADGLRLRPRGAGTAVVAHGGRKAAPPRFFIAKKRCQTQMPLRK